MKKLFTLVCGLAMALCANAAEQISTAFGSWGDGCTVEGNTLTFTEAWKGAGVGFVTGDGETEPKKCTDFSDYDYLWVTFSETTCDFVLCTQYTTNYNQPVQIDAVAGTLGEGRIYGHFRTEPGADGTGTFGICQTEQSGTFQHFCELTRLSEKGYSNRHMRTTRKVRCPYER